jgi:hypothetical protein
MVGGWTKLRNEEAALSLFFMLIIEWYFLLMAVTVQSSVSRL